MKALTKQLLTGTATALLTLGAAATSFAETSAQEGFSVLQGVPTELMSTNELASTEGKSFFYLNPNGSLNTSVLFSGFHLFRFGVAGAEFCIVASDAAVLGSGACP